MSARGYAELRDVLAEVYTPEGVDIWLDSRHVQLGGRSVEEMMDEGGEAEQQVIDLARSLAGMIAS